MNREELKKEAQEQVNYCTPLYPESFIQGYLAGAEPREKRIVELEGKLEQTEKDLADYQFNYPKIKELEKENAELKAKNKWYSEQVCNNECAEVWGNLTKAKKLLKQFLEAKNSEDTYKAEWEAEQFLKEIKENANLKSNIKREIFPEIILPEGSEEHIDKVIADAEKRLGD